MELAKGKTVKQKTVSISNITHKIKAVFPDSIVVELSVEPAVLVETIAKQFETQWLLMRTYEGTHDDDLNVLQLYNASGWALKFSCTVGESLDQEATIYAVTSFEDLFFLNAGSPSGAYPQQLMDDKLMECIHNSISLQCFFKFCINECCIENLLLWMEIEMFKSIKLQPVLEIFIRHIYACYLQPNSPLAINIDVKSRKNIFDFDGDRNESMFNELQQLVFGFLKVIYSQFEKSIIFSEMKASKSENYNTKRQYLFNDIVGSHGLDFIHEMKKIVSILENPTSKESIDDLSKLGKSVTATNFKLHVLKNVSARYMTDFSIPKQYFDTTAAHKVRNEKKRNESLKTPSTSPTVSLGGPSNDKVSTEVLNMFVELYYSMENYEEMIPMAFLQRINIEIKTLTFREKDIVLTRLGQLEKLIRYDMKQDSAEVLDKNETEVQPLTQSKSKEKLAKMLGDEASSPTKKKGFFSKFSKSSEALNSVGNDSQSSLSRQKTSKLQSSMELDKATPKSAFNQQKEQDETNLLLDEVEKFKTAKKAAT